MNWHEIDQKAKQWIYEAGERIRQSFQQKLVVEAKSGPNDLVTNIDREVEHFFWENIRKTFPEHSILGEEGSGHELKSLDGIVWIIDPIDGTMNFVHQKRNFCISVAVFADGVGQIGLIYDVVRDEMYHAIRGNGAYLNKTELPPLQKKTIEECIIGLNASWLVENRRIDPAILSPLVKRLRGTRSFGSAALEFAYVAAGKLDGYITMRLAPWDFAAGLILVDEVGGVTTTLDGKPVDLLKKQSIFTANQTIHQQIIEEYIKGKI